jgi:hypothetical protein
MPPMEKRNEVLVRSMGVSDFPDFISNVATSAMTIGFDDGDEP